MPQTADSTAKLMGFSQEMVRRYVNTAFEKLRGCPATSELLNNPPKAEMAPVGYGKAVNRFDFTARNKARNN
jgi:hypothetical protein